MIYWASFAVLCLAACTSAINVTQCHDSAKTIDNLSDNVKIGACNKAPCRLRRNTSVNIELKFTPESDIATLRNSVYAYIIGVPFPFVGVDQTDACLNMFKSDGTTKASCPLKAGEQYVYKNKIDVLQIYPKIKLVVHWGLTGPTGDAICFEVPARITN